ncbi:GGDEF domain-containing protein [Parasulfuritortus cantonensis]|uniref:diguanylate cyclase n=1 Tax=Parasulfuritortus cantonensis TaxID=2528202 RepID=A0A4R1B1S9_9PROT|nr:GGDEF domain-containing protein [Parasulfuritortus cantonensis]TCJ11974.1 GGDEF domain-containing protein [Parasulfuritortus cantonensis]
MNNEAPGNRFHGLLGNLGKLTSIRDTELVEQSLLRTLGPLLGVLDTELYRLDESQTVVRVIYSHRSKVVDSDGGARLVERIEEITNPGDLPAEVVALTDNVRLLRRPCTRRQGDQVLIAYPLVGDGDVHGYFLFKRDREVSPNEDTVIRGVLEVFSNYYALLDVSMRDRLTGLFNRQALENSFERLWTAVGRPTSVSAEDDTPGRRGLPSHSYWLAVIDVDHFKRINDTYGHMVGDEILLLVARLMTSIFRSTDLLYRYGGEEFVAIINAETAEIAHNIFERVRLGIAAHHFPRIDSLAVSIGYAAIAPNLLPVEVLSRADRSLYQAKQDGRNRIYDYQELVDTGVFKDVDYAEPEFF